VNQNDPRFTVGIAAIRSIQLDGYPPRRDRLGSTRYYPGEVAGPIGQLQVEAMVLAEKHFEFVGAHEWVTIQDMLKRVDARPGLPYVLGFAKPGVAELYNRIPYPDPETSHLKVTNYVFAVLNWEQVLARDAAFRLGATETRPEGVIERKYG
jgi:hypothetical protein